MSNPPHGKCFKKWANIAMRHIPDVAVTTTALVGGTIIVVGLLLFVVAHSSTPEPPLRRQGTKGQRTHGPVEVGPKANFHYTWLRILPDRQPCGVRKIPAVWW